MKDRDTGYNVFQNISHLLGMAYKHYRIVFVFILIEMVCNGLLPLFGLYLPKIAVELVLDNQGLSQAMRVLGIFSVAYVLVACLGQIASQGKYPLQNSLRFIYARALFEKALECDYALMETSEGQTWYEKARGTITSGDASATSQMLWAIVGLVSGLISFAFIFTLISQLSVYILALLIILSVANYVFHSRALDYENKQQDKSADLRKKTYYMEKAMADVGAAKDIRIYDLAALFVGVRDRILHRSFELRAGIKNRHFLANAVQLLITVCRDGVAYAYCIRQVMNGSISVADFVLYMSAIASFASWLNGIIGNILTLRRDNTRMNDLRAFFEATNRLDPENPLPIASLSGALDIEFRAVGFRYTPDTPKVLDGLSFHIRCNEKVALVGVNGAGKTTIIKLLCGFYKADEGEILINGHNIDAFKRADLYTLFSAVFQDICILPLSVRENVAYAKAAQCDEARLLRCLDMAGLKDEILRHAKGLDTPMLKDLEPDGIVLSGGQQQKLLLARALYKDAPILILDEPTAALDPIAESEVYEKFHEVTAGKTAIYISHRLASTRFCDRILMLKDGRIIQSGSHDALMAENGDYAHMFEVQSHYYKREVEAV